MFDPKPNSSNKNTFFFTNFSRIHAETHNHSRSSEKQTADQGNQKYFFIDNFSLEEYGLRANILFNI